jgi:hypothetical protein
LRILIALDRILIKPSLTANSKIRRRSRFPKRIATPAKDAPLARTRPLQGSSETIAQTSARAIKSLIPRGMKGELSGTPTNAATNSMKPGARSFGAERSGAKAYR